MGPRSLSRTQAKVILSLEADGQEELDLVDLRRRAGASSGFARKIAHDLVRKGWLQRTGRGRYLLNPSWNGPDAIGDTDPLRVGSRIASPYYFGFATAAELLGLLPEASSTYYVVTPSRGSAGWAHAARFRRVRVAPQRFFGFQGFERRGVRLVVSDVERTVIDCLGRPELSGGLGGVARILDSAGPRLNWRRLERYLVRLGVRSLSRRLGYMVETLGTRAQPPVRWIRRARARPEEPYSPLGSPKEFGRRGTHDVRWHVIQNVPERILRSELEIR